MSRSKIVVRTSEAKKNALQDTLDKRGLSMTDWFEEKISEVVETYTESTQESVERLEQPHALHDESDIIRKIEDIDWSFTDSDTTYLSHGIHPYSAKFIPQIPHYLIQILSLRGETVWDPFAGSGTTALESLLLGRRAISSDVNPLSKLIGRAKTATLTSSEVEKGEELANDVELLSSNRLHFSEEYNRNEEAITDHVPEIPNREKWFHKNVLRELGYLAWRIDRLSSDSLTAVAQSALSKIVVGVSYQDSETRYTSVEREVEEGETLRKFAAQLNSILQKTSRLSSLIGFRKATFETSDLRYESPVPENSVDLIVTSPPYPNATDYHLYHRFRLFWIGHDPRKLGSKEIGSHLRHQKEDTGIDQYLDEMSECLKRMREALRPGRYAVLVVGDSVFDDETYKTASLVGEVAQDCGFSVPGLVSRDLHDTKRSFISAARRLKEEKLLVLRNPPADSTHFVLKGPNYTPWSYEEDLRRREASSLLAQDIPESEGIGEDVRIDADPFDARQLKRLTFTHGFEGSEYSLEKTWQSNLENGKKREVESSSKNSTYVTHGVHSYKGKFYPQIVKSMLNMSRVSVGDTVLDPYCGSGTVLLESFLNGFDAHGLELNPLAEKISRVKYSILEEDAYIVEKTLSNFERDLNKLEDNSKHRNVFEDEVLSELDSWFPEPVVSKLGWITKRIEKVSNPQIREFIEVCLSSIVRKVSQQDPKDLRIRRRKPPIDDAPVQSLLQSHIEEQKSRVIGFSKVSNMSPYDFGNVSVHRGDCRIEEAYRDVGIGKGTVDCIITSPPYAMALPYIDTDRLSILLLYGMQSQKRKNIERDLTGARNIKKSERRKIDQKIESEEFKKINSGRAINIIKNIYKLNKNADVGFRRKNKASLLYRYYRDLSQSLDNMSKVLKPGGSIFLVIGNNKTKAGDKMKEINIETSEVLKEMGKNRKWGMVDDIKIEVTKEDKNHSKNSITENEIIWFKK